MAVTESDDLTFLTISPQEEDDKAVKELLKEFCENITVSARHEVIFCGIV